MSTDPWRDLDAAGGRFTHRRAGDRAERSLGVIGGSREHHAEECWKAWEEFDRAARDVPAIGVAQDSALRTPLGGSADHSFHDL